MFKFKTKWFPIVVCLLTVGFVLLAIGGVPEANATPQETANLELHGDEHISLYVGDTYIEPGFTATNELGEDLSESVIVVSTVDTTMVGKYPIVYILKDIVKIRTVMVEEQKVFLEPEFHYAEAKTTANFSNDITLSYSYVEGDNLMPFGFITPSSAKDSEKIPLIISLHGQSERGCNANTFKNKFVINLMRNWEMEGFNAYVIFPHLTGNYYSDSWNSPTVANNVFDLIDWVVANYNVDPNRIIIQGQSMGGYGCLYMATYHPEYFAACVPISAYDSNVDLEKLDGIAMRCYVGNSRNGEDSRSEQFVLGKLASVVGEETINHRTVSHNEIPIVAYTEDLDENNRSDLLEWMFEQIKIHE